MRVIFLDIDGVLNDYEYMRSMVSEEDRAEGKLTLAERCSDIDPVKVERLKRIIEATGAKVCFSTSWRKMIGAVFSSGEYTLKRLIDDVGITEDDVVGVTPSLEHNSTREHRVWRGDEIMAWMRERPEITSYVILEDDKDPMMPESRLIHTSFQEGGLREDHVQQAIDILESPRLK